jgi:hypothetical protein
MRTKGGVIRATGAVIKRGSWSLVQHRAIILLIAIVVGLVFLAATNSPVAYHDTRSVAIGLGVACGAVCVMLARNRTLTRALSSMRDRVEELSDKNWELTGKIEAGPDLADARDRHTKFASRSTAFSG